MTEVELNTFNEVKERIDVLEEEIYALFEAQGKRINPVKRLIKTFSQTKKRNYGHDCTIQLSLMDIRLLQDIRQQELNTLRKIIKEEGK